MATEESIIDRMKREALEAHQMVAETFPDDLPYDNGHPDLVLRKRDWGGYNVVVRGRKIGWVTNTRGEWHGYLVSGGVNGIPVIDDGSKRRYMVQAILWKSRDIGRRGYLPL